VNPGPKLQNARRTAATVEKISDTDIMPHLDRAELPLGAFGGLI
jgi:hypothetical protein